MYVHISLNNLLQYDQIESYNILIAVIIGADVGVLGGPLGASSGGYWGIFGSDFVPLVIACLQWNEIAAKDSPVTPS